MNTLFLIWMQKIVASELVLDACGVRVVLQDKVLEVMQVP